MTVPVLQMQKRAMKKAPSLAQSETVLKNRPLLGLILSFNTPVELFKCRGVAVFWNTRVGEIPVNFWRSALKDVRDRQYEHERVEIMNSVDVERKSMEYFARYTGSVAPFYRCSQCGLEYGYVVVRHALVAPRPLRKNCPACQLYADRDQADKQLKDGEVCAAVREAEKALSILP